MNEHDETICAGTDPGCLHTKSALDRWAWHRLPDGRSLCPVCWAPARIPLSQLIDRICRLDGTERVSVPAHQREHLTARLRELRARRIAMGREPDDEVNAPADMCCCGRQFADGWTRPPQFRDGCPLHPGGYDGSTGAEFLEAATGALGGGVELTEDMGFCLGCGSRECCCPAVTAVGPLLRCGRFRLKDCGVAELFDDCPDCAYCEPAEGDETV